MLIAVLKAFLMGIIVAVPIGPVLFFVIQKTVCDGRRAGRFAGLGSAFADTLYAAVGVYALGLIRDFIDKNTPLIMLVGGLLIVLIGIGMFRRKITMPKDGQKPSAGKPMLWYSSQTAICALSNPTALAVAMGLLALLHLDSTSLDFPAWIVLPFVFAGELSYWWFVTFALNRFLHPSEKTLTIISRIAACIVICFGLFLAIKGLTALL